MQTPDIIADIVKQREELAKSRENQVNQYQLMRTVLGSVSEMLQNLEGELKRTTYKNRIVNLPTTQKVKGSVEVSNFKSIETGLLQLKKAVDQISLELPDVFSVNGTVEVSNFPEFPEIVIPEHPKQLKSDITSLPKYVKETLEAINRSVKALEVSPQISVSPADVNIDLKTLENKLETLTESVNALLEKEVVKVPEVDFSGLVTKLEALEERLEEVRDKPIPIPSFHSSWSKSFDMQSKDLPASLGYTSNDPDNPDYIEVTADDGNTYRKTFTYDTVGGTKVVTAYSAWVIQ